MTLCFRAAAGADLKAIPDWLSVEFSWEVTPRPYEIWVVPWVAEPARALGALELDGSVAAWIVHLERLGFRDVVEVRCAEFLSPRVDRDR